jgi:hypothetical protein
MAETKIDLKKKVFSKSQYTKTIDTQFSELGVTTLQEDLASQIDVNQFFQVYNDLFYEIPSNGETNSHEFLVKTSGEYINYDQIQEEIEALRQEITGLREENLELQVEITRFQTGEEIDVGALVKEAESQTTDTKISSQNLISNNINTSNPSIIGGSTGGSTGGGY